jgi:uncharacterized RDD family membrane protein YckC
MFLNLMIMQPSGFNVSETLVDNQYIMVIDGKPAGPFSIEELKANHIKPGSFVKTASMGDYKEAHEVAELRQLFGFSKRALPLQYFGSFDQRLLASVIDWLIISGVFILLAFVGVVLVDDKTMRIYVAVGLLSPIPVANFIYHIVMESSAKQGTYGKQLLNIRVTDLEGQRIDTTKAFARNFLKLLSTLTFYVGFLMSFFNKKQQCLHDMIAETLVIKDRL